MKNWLYFLRTKRINSEWLEFDKQIINRMKEK
jgi:hypothetical protein